MKKAFLITLIVLASNGLMAQSNKAITFGASASVDFGRFQDRIEITPNVAVRIAPKIYLGLGPTVSFYSTQNSVFKNKANINEKLEVKDKIWYLGGEMFLQFVPFEHKESFINNVFLQTSFEALFGNGVYRDQSGKYDYNINNYTPLVGIGYEHSLIEGLTLAMSLNFKLNNEHDSPYRNPITRIAIKF